MEAFVGHTILNITDERGQPAHEGADELVFTFSDGATARMWHKRECCEHVYLAEIVGDLADLVGSPVLTASVETQDGGSDGPASHTTWTFYKLATARGYVTLRWLGESNGSYSESVSLSFALAAPLPADAEAELEMAEIMRERDVQYREAQAAREAKAARYAQITARYARRT